MQERYNPAEIECRWQEKWAQEKCAELSDKLCAFVKVELGISPDRVYIEFWDINGKMFGWNGGTF